LTPVSRDGTDPGVLAGLVLDLVQDLAGSGGREDRSYDAAGTCRRLAEEIGAPTQQRITGVTSLTIITLQGARPHTLAQSMVWPIRALPGGVSTFDVCFELGRMAP